MLRKLTDSNRLAARAEATCDARTGNRELSSHILFSTIVGRGFSPHDDDPSALTELLSIYDTVHAQQRALQRPQARYAHSALALDSRPKS